MNKPEDGQWMDYKKARTVAEKNKKKVTFHFSDNQSDIASEMSA